MKRFFIVMMLLIAWHQSVSGFNGDGGYLHGQVFVDGDVPIPGALIVVDPFGLKTTSDADGSFEFGPLQPGPCEITVSLHGFADELRSLELKPRKKTTVTITLKPHAFEMEKVVVTAPYSVFTDDSETNVTLDRRKVETLPHVGDDLFRVVGCLPGVSSNDMSSDFSIRGGLSRDSLVLLDGIELFEPFHMKEYMGIISIVDPEIVGNMNLIPGGFTAEYGDRSSGVLEIDTLEPDKLTTTLGMSFSAFQLNSAGIFDDDRGYWLFSGRRGFMDVVMKLAGAEEDGEKETIRFWDGFGKIGYHLTPNNEVIFGFLAADDSMDLEENEPNELLDLESSYGNSYTWLKHKGILTNRLLVETTAYAGRVDDKRTIHSEEFGDISDVRDDRSVDIFGAKQDWAWDINQRHYLKWGWEYRRYKADYDYMNAFDFTNAIPDPRFLPPSGNREYAGRYTESQYSAYLSDQIQILKRLSAEVGVRFDHYSVSDEDVVGPRVNLVYDLADNQALRMSWGQYYQSHKPHELDVQDGDFTYYEAEKTHQYTVGYEAQFGKDFKFRCDAYYRVCDNPRPRYENLFDVIAMAPEASADRIRLDPEESVAKGLELFMAHRFNKKFDWWLNYTLSYVEDTINGSEMYRNQDQRHAAKIALNYHPGQRWDVNLTWHYHSGWPSTQVTAEYVDDGQGGQMIVPIVGEFYNERYPGYHRLDLRINYRFPFKGGEFTTYIDVQNLYDRKNISGYSFEDNPYRENADGTVDFVPAEEEWLGILPSFGIKYRF